jgi:hypothetical protein
MLGGTSTSTGTGTGTGTGTEAGVRAPGRPVLVEASPCVSCVSKVDRVLMDTRST